MTSQWNVLARFRQLIDIDDDKAEDILPLCVVNLKRILVQLNENADKDDIRIAEAAAALTYYDYAVKLNSQTDEVTSFKAGDVTVSKSVSTLTEAAEKIKSDALIELIPLMKDTNFVFMNI